MALKGGLKLNNDKPKKSVPKKQGNDKEEKKLASPKKGPVNLGSQNKKPKKPNKQQKEKKVKEQKEKRKLISFNFGKKDKQEEKITPKNDGPRIRSKVMPSKINEENNIQPTNQNNESKPAIKVTSKITKDGTPVNVTLEPINKPSLTDDVSSLRIEEEYQARATVSNNEEDKKPVGKKVQPNTGEANRTLRPKNTATNGKQNKGTNESKFSRLNKRQKIEDVGVKNKNKLKRSVESENNENSELDTDSGKRFFFFPKNQPITGYSKITELVAKNFSTAEIIGDNKHAYSNNAFEKKEYSVAELYTNLTEGFSDEAIILTNKKSEGTEQADEPKLITIEDNLEFDDVLSLIDDNTETLPIEPIEPIELSDELVLDDIETISVDEDIIPEESNELRMSSVGGSLLDINLDELENEINNEISNTDSEFELENLSLEDISMDDLPTEDTSEEDTLSEDIPTDKVIEDDEDILSKLEDLEIDNNLDGINIDITKGEEVTPSLTLSLTDEVPTESESLGEEISNENNEDVESHMFDLTEEDLNSLQKDIELAIDELNKQNEEEESTQTFTELQPTELHLTKSDRNIVIPSEEDLVEKFSVTNNTVSLEKDNVEPKVVYGQTTVKTEEKVKELNLGLTFQIEDLIPEEEENVLSTGFLTKTSNQSSDEEVKIINPYDGEKEIFSKLNNIKDAIEYI